MPAGRRHTTVRDCKKLLAKFEAMAVANPGRRMRTSLRELYKACTGARGDPDRLALAVTAGVSHRGDAMVAVDSMHVLTVHPSFRKDAGPAFHSFCKSFILPIFHLAVMIGKGGLPQY
jgi:hypothetical protein